MAMKHRMSKSPFFILLVLGLGASMTRDTRAGQAGTQSGDKHPIVVLDTTLGEIVLELDAEKAPITVENFLKYVDDKFYDGLIFHRVIPTFMIQGGGHDTQLREKTEGVRPPILNESRSGLSNLKGTIAMARKPDPNSATCQFFINRADNPQLDRAGGGYTAFGKVVAGMDVVDKIAQGRTTSRIGPDRRQMDDVPVEAVVIRSARRKTKG
jgi:cyclophilin family peptidyl-prolyl cis-trans isomerase